MLTQFNKIVLTIATIILIIMLIFTGFFLNRSMYNDNFPPVISDCPDYWDVSLNSNGDKNCINIMDINTGLGTSNCRSRLLSLFNVNGNSKDEILCSKQKWAKDCKINWDGITNNNNLCNNSLFY